MEAWEKQEAELNDVISKCQHPEFFVGKMMGRDIYFNPVHHCALCVDYDYEIPCHTWWIYEMKFFDFIKRVYEFKLHSSPAPVFQQIINLFHQYNVEISDEAYKILSQS